MQNNRHGLLVNFGSNNNNSDSISQDVMSVHCVSLFLMNILHTLSNTVLTKPHNADAIIIRILKMVKLRYRENEVICFPSVKAVSRAHALKTLSYLL